MKNSETENVETENVEHRNFKKPDGQIHTTNEHTKEGLKCDKGSGTVTEPIS